MKCLECGKETSNPKFCSRSCSATYNNRGINRHGTGKMSKCLNCNKKLNRKLKKYCSHKCQFNYQRKQYIKRWKLGLESGTKGKKYKSISRYVRIYLLESSDYACSVCGWRETNKYTNTIPLEIDHIDGDWTNNSYGNHRVLCPNCHSLTATHCGANTRKAKEKRNGGRTWMIEHGGLV